MKLLKIIVIILVYSDFIFASSYDLEKIKMKSSFSDFLIKKADITLSEIKDYKQVRYICSNSKYIALLDASQKIFIYTIEGKYLGVIDKKGKGPGEYSIAAKVLFIEDDKIAVFDSPRNLMVVFSINRTDIKFSTDYDLSKHNFIGDGYYPRANTIVAINSPLIKDHSRVYIFDKKFDVLAKNSDGWGRNEATIRGAICITEKNIVLGDIVKIKNNKILPISRKFYIHDHLGKRIKTGTHKKNDIAMILIDKESNVLFIPDMQEIYLYDVKKAKFITKKPFKFPGGEGSRYFFDSYQVYSIISEKDNVIRVVAYEIKV